jgi:putative transcription factor
MCGKEENLIKADVEGVELKVCSACAKYGKVKKPVRSSLSAQRYKRTFQKKEEPNFKICDDFAYLIRKSRESKEMSQEDFSKFLNERESIVAKWEAGSLKPRINVARNLERKLGIRIVQKDIRVSADLKNNKKNDELTLGDFVKVRKKN